MRPESDSHPAPFGEQGWMVVFRFCQRPNPVGESQRLRKILEFENAFQARSTTDQSAISGFKAAISPSANRGSFAWTRMQ
jgi:hypothetical protein